MFHICSPAVATNFVQPPESFRRPFHLIRVGRTRWPLGPAPLEGSASRQAGSLRPDTGPLSGPFLRVGWLFDQGSSRNSGPLWGLIAQLCFLLLPELRSGHAADSFCNRMLRNRTRSRLAVRADRQEATPTGARPCTCDSTPPGCWNRYFSFSNSPYTHTDEKWAKTERKKSGKEKWEFGK